MDSTTQDDFFWLFSEAALGLLEKTQSAFLHRENSVRIAKSLRKQTSVTRSALVMDQAQLRIRARAKFCLADTMFFTRRGLEQSTSDEIAKYKAKKFSGLSSIADICCGIGGDLMSLVGRDSVSSTVGVDADSITSRFAKYNGQLVAQPPGQSIEILPIQFEDLDLADFDAVHCDPDRRMAERTVVGSRFSPPLDEVFARVGLKKNLAVKVAPATPLSNRLPSSIEREWIGDRRECKQQVIWHGSHVANPGFRTATCVDGDKVHQMTVPEEELQSTVAVANQLCNYLYEPHPSVLAAGLTDVLGQACGLSRMAIDVAYLTASQATEHPLLSRFEIVEAFPLDLKTTIEYLKKRNVGTVEVKKRGVGKLLFDQFERMKLSGPNRATVFLTRIGTQRIVAIGRREPTDF
jgi:hypothetical protein